MACQSNIRQMAVAMNLYALDHDGKTMPFTHNQGEYWFHQLAPYLNAKEYKDDPEGHDEKMKVAFCPLAKRQKGRTEGSFYGSAITAWRFMGGEGGYGLNLWLLPENEIYGGDLPSENFFKQYTDARGDVPLMGDSMWVGSWPFSGDAMPDDLTGEVGYPGYAHAKGYFMGRFCIDRHKQAINIGFVDTRVARTKLKDLWSLKWHRQFKTSASIN